MTLFTDSDSESSSTSKVTSIQSPGDTKTDETVQESRRFLRHMQENVSSAWKNAKIRTSVDRLRLIAANDPLGATLNRLITTVYR